MTFEDVEEERRVERQIRRKEREIREMRENVLPSRYRSVTVNGKEIYTTGGQSSLPSSPVERFLRDLQRMEEEHQRLCRIREKFRADRDIIPDDEIRSIIYWRTDQLRTWEQIGMIVMRSPNRSTPLMRLQRYLAGE